MDLHQAIDERLILNVLEAYPEGIGQRQLIRALKGKMTHRIVPRKLKALVEANIVEETTQGQGLKHNYRVKTSWSRMISVFSEIENDVNRTLEQIESYSITSYKDVAGFHKEIVDPLFFKFSFPYLVSDILEWDEKWLASEKLVSSLLLRLFIHYIQTLDKIMDKRQVHLDDFQFHEKMLEMNDRLDSVTHED